MKKRISEQVRLRSPKRRVVARRPDKGAFFPGEVARMLGIEQIDHQRLRRVWILVRAQRGTPVPKGTKEKKEWARFDYTDIACTIEVIRMCVDRDRLAGTDFRLALVYIDRACKRLRDLGLENPLLQARLDFNGKQVVASIGGTTFDVQTGQALIEEAIDLTSSFIEQLGRGGAGRELLARSQEERDEVIRQSRGQMTTQFKP